MRTDQLVTGRPRLAAHLRLKFDAVRGQSVLLGPESVSVLNRTGADIVRLCDGRRTVADIEAELRRHYGRVPTGEVQKFLARLQADRCLVTDARVEVDNG